MIPLLIGIGAFISAFVCHAVIWRFSLFARTFKNLIRTLFFCGFFSLQINFILVPEMTLAAAVASTLLFIAMSFTYLIGYSAVEASSPTLTLYPFIRNSHEGVEYQEMVDLLNEHSVVKVRLQLLLTEGLCKTNGNKLTLVKEPPLLFKLVSFHRRFIGNSHAGG